MAGTHAYIAKRQQIERRIFRAVVRQLKAAGYTVALSSERGFGEHDAPRGSSMKKMLEVFSNLDEAHLMVWPPNAHAEERAKAFVQFVMGNGGWDVIADHSVSIEAHLTEAFAIADQY